MKKTKKVKAKQELKAQPILMVTEYIEISPGTDVAFARLIAARSKVNHYDFLILCCTNALHKAGIKPSLQITIQKAAVAIGNGLLTRAEDKWESSWAFGLIPQPLVVSKPAYEKIVRLIKEPPRPSQAMIDAFKAHGELIQDENEDEP